MPTATIAVPSAPAIADAAAPVALHGSITGGGTNMYVAVYALPKPSTQASSVGSKNTLYRLPDSTVTVSGSSYSVNISNGALPTSVRDRNGDVTFVTLTENQSTLKYAVHTATARYVPAQNGSTAHWTDPIHAVSSPRTARAAQISGVDVSTHVAATASAPARASRAVAKRSYTDYVGVKQAWATIGTGYPVGGSTSWMTWKNNSSSTFTSSFGVAISYSVAKGADASANWNQSGTQTVSRSFGFEWDPNSAGRKFQVGVTYVHAITHLSDLECYQGVYCSYSTWAPGRYNGGTRSVYNVTRPVSWHYCVRQSAGTFTRYRAAGSSFTASRGAQLAFLNWSGSSERAYNLDAELKYHTKEGQRLCGSNDMPPYASQIIEKPRL
ncbi:hypothetical protein [Nocardioides montaniterrae]